MYLGIDLGSRSIKLALLRDGNIVDQQMVESSFDPAGQLHVLAGQFPATLTVATGFGRHLAHPGVAQGVITEIKAHALGARHFFPECRTILDVGGQDAKVIALDRQGRVATFQMNDKCAAGTGRFLEMMALGLGYSLSDFGAAAATTGKGVTIGSMCAVFAESEVVSLKNRGCPPHEIAHAVHRSVVERLAAMVQRLPIGSDLIFSGGVAQNHLLVQLLAEKLGVPVLVPPHPAIVGALGAALHAASLS